MTPDFYGHWTLYGVDTTRKTGVRESNGKLSRGSYMKFYYPFGEDYG